LIQAFALLCLFAFAHASTQPYPFTPCGSGHVQNISIDINPDPPVKGAKVNIKVAGFVDEKVNAGTYQIDVTYVGIPIFSKTGSICSYIKVHNESLPFY
jgi:hypothetical protein